MEKYHPERAAAERAYQAALKHTRAMENQTDPELYDRAVEVENAACSALVAMENKYPTYMERRRRARNLYLANRGIR